MKPLGFEARVLVTFVAPKVTKSAVLQQAGPGLAGTALRDSQPAALMSRSLWSLRHSLSPAVYCVARRLEVAGEQWVGFGAKGPPGQGVAGSVIRGQGRSYS